MPPSFFFTSDAHVDFKTYIIQLHSTALFAVCIYIFNIDSYGKMLMQIPTKFAFLFTVSSYKV